MQRGPRQGGSHTLDYSKDLGSEEALCLLLWQPTKGAINARSASTVLGSSTSRNPKRRISMIIRITALPRRAVPQTSIAGPCRPLPRKTFGLRLKVGSVLPLIAPEGTRRGWKKHGALPSHHVGLLRFHSLRSRSKWAHTKSIPTSWVRLWCSHFSEKGEHYRAGAGSRLEPRGRGLEQTRNFGTGGRLAIQV
jgi:hypothetical protein